MLDQFNASFPLARRSEANDEEGARREQAGNDCRTRTEKARAIKKRGKTGTPDGHGWTTGIATQRRSEKVRFVKEDHRSPNGFRHETARKETERKPRTNLSISIEVP